MIAKAISKNIRVSPLKLRLYVDSVRGNNLEQAYNWLQTCSVKRIVPIQKILHSAFSNARHKDAEISNMPQMRIKEIKVDKGSTIKYFKPGAMGRVSPQRKRLSHLSVVLEKIEDNK